MLSRPRLANGMPLMYITDMLIDLVFEIAEFVIGFLCKVEVRGLCHVAPKTYAEKFMAFLNEVFVTLVHGKRVDGVVARNHS